MALMGSWEQGQTRIKFLSEWQLVSWMTPIWVALQFNKKRAAGNLVSFERELVASLPQSHIQKPLITHLKNSAKQNFLHSWGASRWGWKCNYPVSSTEVSKELASICNLLGFSHWVFCSLFFSYHRKYVKKRKMKQQCSVFWLGNSWKHPTFQNSYLW